MPSKPNFSISGMLKRTNDLIAQYFSKSLESYLTKKKKYFGRPCLNFFIKTNSSKNKISLQVVEKAW
jgi:hypothetical protein